MIIQSLFSSSLFQSTEDVNAFDARNDARITVTVFGGCFLFIQFFFGAIDTIDADDLFRRCERMEGAEHRYIVPRRAHSSHLLRGKTKKLPRVGAEEFTTIDCEGKNKKKGKTTLFFYSTPRATKSIIFRLHLLLPSTTTLPTLLFLLLFLLLFFLLLFPPPLILRLAFQGCERLIEYF